MGFQKRYQRARGNHEVAIAAAFIGLSLIAITPQLNTNIGGFVSSTVGGSSRDGSKIQVQTLGTNPATVQFDNGNETGGDLSRPSMIPSNNGDNTEVGATLNTLKRSSGITSASLGNKKEMPQSGIELGNIHFQDEATGDVLKPLPGTGGNWQTDVDDTGGLIPRDTEVGGTSNRTAAP